MKKDRPKPKPTGRAADAEASKADADAAERYWQERTLAVHEAAEAFYRDTPPLRKIKPRP